MAAPLRSTGDAGIRTPEPIQMQPGVISTVGHHTIAAIGNGTLVCHGAVPIGTRRTVVIQGLRCPPPAGVTGKTHTVFTRSGSSNLTCHVRPPKLISPASRRVHASFALHRKDGRVTVVILSPHFDDAVLSCWHVLRAPGTVQVVNVFTGAPPEGSPPGWWDRLTGAPDPGERVRERAEEDRIALRLAGATVVNLDLLEAQHRSYVPSIGDLAGDVREAVSRCRVVYAPTGLGDHADHVLVREAALRLVEETGCRLRLYADLPHAIGHGWPTWVATEGSGLADREWAAAVAELRVLRLQPDVHELSDDERRGKLAALRAYRTQLAELERMSGSLESVLRYEVTWEAVPA